MLIFTTSDSLSNAHRFAAGPFAYEANSVVSRDCRHVEVEHP